MLRAPRFPADACVPGADAVGVRAAHRKRLLTPDSSCGNLARPGEEARQLLVNLVGATLSSGDPSVYEDTSLSRFDARTHSAPAPRQRVDVEVHYGVQGEAIRRIEIRNHNRIGKSAYSDSTCPRHRYYDAHEEAERRDADRPHRKHQGEQQSQCATGQRYPGGDGDDQRETACG